MKYLDGSRTDAAQTIAMTPKGIEASQIIRKPYAYPYLAAEMHALKVAVETPFRIEISPGTPTSVKSTAEMRSGIVAEETPAAMAVLAWRLSARI